MLYDVPCSIYIGFDPKAVGAFAVARSSARAHIPSATPIYGVVLSTLIADGLYTRTIERHPSAVDGDVLWDPISEAPMSTEFAISRFLVPHLARRSMLKGLPAGWALFMDCDVLVRANLDRLFETFSRDYAAYCVKHDYRPIGGTKMDGQLNREYPRKNWSSVIAFNVDHPSNKKLTLDMVNGVPGRDLHALCWLQDSEIGSIDPGWNWLVGEQPEPEGGAKVVHWTLGGPWIDAFREGPYADEYRYYLHRWAA